MQSNSVVGEGIRRTATPAERVRLVVALAKAGSSLRCNPVSLEIRPSGWLRRVRRTHFGSGTESKSMSVT